MNNKRFVLILIAVILLLLAGATVYFFVRQVQKQKQPPTPVVQQEQRVSQLFSEPVISPILSFNGQTIWFLTKAGRLFRTPALSPPNLGGDKEGVKEEFPLPQSVANPMQVLWPNESGDFIAQENADGHLRYEFFDSRARAFTQYDPRVRSPQFLAGGNKIVYDWGMGLTQHELTIADPNSANFKKVVNLYPGNYELAASPQKQEVALFTRDPNNPVSLSLLDLSAVKFQDMGPVAAYEGAKFSPDGTKLLAAQIVGNSETPPLLVMFDLQTQNMKDLGIPAKIAQTAWTKDSQAVVIGSSAGFVRYNLAGQNQQEVYKFSNAENFAPRDLLLHPDKPILFFTDEKTGYLYRLDLK